MPIFESPDEPHHWQYARHLHYERRLPIFGPDFIEANSPPLYYAVIAPVAIKSDAPPPLSWLDARGGLIFPFFPRYFHNAGGDLQRYRPIRAARLLSVLLSLLGVWFTYRCGVEVGGRSVGLAAAALMAFLPQFTFRGATVSNDVLVTTLAAATMWCAVLLARRGFTWRVALLLAVSLAGAYLSKISAICLVGPAALAVFWSSGPLRTRIVRTGAVLAAALLLVAPWSIRNVMLYGDPFASGAMHTAVSYLIVQKPLTSPYFWTVFPSVLSRSFVGVFGWMNVYLPERLYWLYWGVGLAGLAGIALQAARRRVDVRVVAIMAAAVVLNFGVVVHINRSFDQPQGRYMFPALPATVLLVAAGVLALLRSERRRVAAARALAVGLALANGFILARIVVPSYYPPVTSSLSDEYHRLREPQVVGLERGRADELRLMGADPQVVYGTNLETRQAGFLQFDVSGSSGGGEMVGAVYFATNHQAFSEERHVPFRWRADGQQQRITVPLLAHPLWKGRVTSIRIDPVNTAVDRHVGTTLRIDRVRLSDNLRVGAFPLMSIDLPAAGTAVHVPFVVAGWAIDVPVGNRRGIDAVHVWAFPAAGVLPIFLGAAEHGGSRPDVAAVYGPQFEQSGFGLQVNDLPPGRYVIVVFTRGALAGTFNQSGTVVVEVR